MDNKILSKFTKPLEFVLILLALGTAGKYANAQTKLKDRVKEKVSMIISDEDSLVVKKPENWKERRQLRKELAANMNELKYTTANSIDNLLEKYNPRTSEKKRFAQTSGLVARYRGYLVEYNDWYNTYYKNIVLVTDSKGNVIKTKKGKNKERALEKFILRCDNDVTPLKVNIDNEFIKYIGAKDSLVYKPAADKFIHQGN